MALREFSQRPMMMTTSLVFALTMTGAGSCKHSASQLEVYHGEPVAQDHPLARSTVSLRTNEGKPHCSATLIGPDTALTAAHCFDMADDLGFAPAGEQRDLYGRMADFPEARVSVKIKSVRIHPMRLFQRAYVWKRMRSEEMARRMAPAADVAVVTFADRFDQSRYPPVELLPPAEILNPGDKVTIAGFGRTETGTKGSLHSAEMTVGEIWNQNGLLLLTGENKASACHGDSGGPALVTRHGKMYLVGTTSTAFPGKGCDAGLSLYTDLRQLSDFIGEPRDPAGGEADRPKVTVFDRSRLRDWCRNRQNLSLETQGFLAQIFFQSTATACDDLDDPRTHPASLKFAFDSAAAQENLDLSLVKLPTADWEILRALATRELSFDSREYCPPKTTLKYLPRGLAVLEAKFCGWMDVDGLESLKNLKRLDLSFNNLGKIGALTALENLEYLNVDGNVGITDLPSLSAMPNLRHLSAKDGVPRPQNGCPLRRGKCEFE